MAKMSPSETVKILHVISSLASGGAEMMLRKLAVGTNPDKYIHLIVSMTDGGMHEVALRDGGIRVISLGMKPGMPSWSSLRHMRTLCRSFRPHVIQSWLYHADALVAAMRISDMETRTPAWLWNIRSSDADLGPPWAPTRLLRRGLAAISGRPAAILVNSRAGREFHVSLGYKPRRWIYVPNGYDCDSYRSDPSANAWLRRLIGCDSDEAIISMIARFDRNKDHETFISAFSLLRQKRPRVRAVLVGRGIDVSNRHFCDMLVKYGISTGVHPLGERGDIARIMAGSTCLVSSSISEGFPNVICEAMACGTPCVVTDAGDSTAIIGDTGLSVPIRDPEKMASALRYLIDQSTSERIQRGKCARSRILSHYNIKSIVKRYECIYDWATRFGSSKACSG